MKLSLKDISKFNQIKDSVDKAYAKLDLFKEKIVAKYGVGIFEIPNPEGGFYRLTIKDQVQALTEGETVFKATGISRYHVEIRETKKSAVIAPAEMDMLG